MPLSEAARRHLTYRLKSTAIGDEIADVIDAGSGTLSAAARRARDYAVADRVTADGLCDKIDAGTALTADQQNKLGYALGNRVVANEIAEALAAT